MRPQNVQHVPLHGDGCRPVERVRRLPHELALAEFEWDPRTGEGVCIYEREALALVELPKHAAIDQENRFRVSRAQPAGRWHAGWQMWNGRFTTGR